MFSLPSSLRTSDFQDFEHRIANHSSGTVQDSHLLPLHWMRCKGTTKNAYMQEKSVEIEFLHLLFLFLYYLVLKSLRHLAQRQREGKCVAMKLRAVSESLIPAHWHCVGWSGWQRNCVPQRGQILVCIVFIQKLYKIKQNYISNSYSILLHPTPLYAYRVRVIFR